MNYELALKLYNAGFVQGKGDYICNHNNPNTLSQSDGMVVCDEGDQLVYNPTLSELIEACEEDFTNLTRIIYEPSWICNYDETNQQSGVTPEEAVAKLYLKLQEKKV